LVLLGVAAGSCSVVRPIVENVHDVVPGTVVRSAQLSPSRLQRLIEDRKIASVLNLRGEHLGADWYDRERAVTQKEHVEQIDFGLSGSRELSAEQADALVRLMKSAPKPMLIHCQAGADRTGLASALYLYAIERDTPERAGEALSVRYHHFKFLPTGAMDRSFDAYVARAQAAAGKAL
jgi:protein tyrosine/serine phosphatase